MKFIIVLLVFSHLLIVNSLAQIWKVPGNFQTIQDAINASSNGDTVLVQPGIYYENINFNGHNIVLASLYLTTGDTSYISSTIIDGDSLGSVVTFESGEDSTTKIIGFTIQRGFAFQGAGIFCSNASPKIEKNLIKNNYLQSGNYDSEGAGIYCSLSSSKIISNIITKNNSTVIFSTSSRLKISGNKIMDNQGGSGVAIYIQYNDSTIISENYFYYSSLQFYTVKAIECRYSYLTIDKNILSRSGGINLYASNPLITNNIICWNDLIDGGGVSCHNSSNPSVVNNVIFSNRDYGVYCDLESHPKLINTILWLNSSTYEDQIYGNPEYVKYCNVQGGWSGIGNIDSDPLFVDPFNDYYNVCAQSPCIDTGDPYILDPDNTQSDIGLFFPDHPETFLGKRWCVSVFGNDSTGNGTYSNPFRTIQKGINTAHHLDTILVENGIYNESINVWFKNLTIASNYALSGNEQDIETTIIREGDGQIVTFYHSNGPASIKGFTIKDGYWPILSWDVAGGGIFCISSKLTISNNYVTNNTSTGPGSGIKCHQSDVKIKNNLISNNYSMSFLGMTSTCGGVFCTDSDVLLQSNTITKNKAEGSASGEPSAGGILLLDSSNAILVNNILWADSAYGINKEIDMYQSNAVVTYCNIQDTIWPGEGNISVDPLFRDTTSGDFHLMATMCGDPFDSPCIDAGNPLIPDKIMDCSWGLGTERSDMGAYGGGDSILVGVKNQEVEIPKEYSLSQNYPNPFNPTTTIQYSIKERSIVELVLYDILGRVVEVLVNEEQDAGYYKVNFNAGNLASGIYLYRLRAGSFVETKKMLLIK